MINLERWLLRHKDTGRMHGTGPGKIKQENYKKSPIYRYIWPQFREKQE